MTPTGALAATADVVLPLHAGVEEGGVACLTFQATLAVLQLLAGRVTGAGPGTDELRPAVDAAAALRVSRGAWLDELADRLATAATTYAIAPAERLSSALQSALMLREGPRLPADATETGDWLHVDVYLSKRPGYTALLFPGSRFDDGVMAYARERGSAIVAIGPAPATARRSTCRSTAPRARWSRCSWRRASPSSPPRSSGVAASTGATPLSCPSRAVDTRVRRVIGSARHCSRLK